MMPSSNSDSDRDSHQFVSVVGNHELNSYVREPFFKKLCHKVILEVIAMVSVLRPKPSTRKVVIFDSLN